MTKLSENDIRIDFQHYQINSNHILSIEDQAGKLITPTTISMTKTTFPTTIKTFSLF